VKNWVLGIGYWVLGIGCWVLGVGLIVNQKFKNLNRTSKIVDQYSITQKALVMGYRYWVLGLGY
jgi:hypothetical protein